jgi:hypothetical protein
VTGETEGANREARRRRAALVLGTALLVCTFVGIGTALASASTGGDVATAKASKRVPKLREIDGGLAYYGQFANGLPTSPGYFPIAAWLRPAYDRDQFRDYARFGMNVFVGVEDPERTRESMIRAHGMKALVQVDERTRFDDIGSETIGWLLNDEIDMEMSPDAGYNELLRLKSSLPADNRLHYNNYGKGVLESDNTAEAARYINGHTGRNTAVQLVSTDYYWFTDPYARGSKSNYGFGSSYGETVTRVRMLDGRDGARQPVWNFVELGWPWSESAAQGGRRILPAEIRSAVWHSVIAGARGIIYFDHNMGPGTPGSTIMGEGYEDNRKAAARVNGQIKSLARVLNSPFVTSRHSMRDTMAGTARYMVKWANGKLWVFVGADHGGGTATFRMPCIGKATAKVMWEKRSIAMRRGSFRDSFADKNAIHIYRIDGGSTCGLR